MGHEFTFAVVGAIALERVAELRLARRNAMWAFARGAVEKERGQYRVMTAFHLLFLIACVGEPLLLDRTFTPALATACIVLLLCAQALRWWAITTLGPRWNTRVIVLPDAEPVTGGPYRWLRHPNYVAVVVEGLALPLLHTAWVTAVVFTLLNAVLLVRFRIPAEEQALAELAPAR